MRLARPGAAGTPGPGRFCPQPAHRTWTGPNVLTPRHPQLLAVKAAGDFGSRAPGSLVLLRSRRIVVTCGKCLLGCFTA
jgi:hypothetical protein